MLSLLSELHFWTTDENLSIKSTDYGSFRYSLKKDASGTLSQSKKSYCDQRGVIWTPANKRPVKLKDKLKELEDYLAQNKVVSAEWQENKLQVLLCRGVLVNITVNEKSGNIASLSFSKSLAQKLQSESLYNAVIEGQQIVCMCTDGRILGIGSQWKDGWSLDGGSRKYLSLYRERLVVWGKVIADHPQPWCPLRRDYEKANLLLYWIGSRGPELLAYRKTDGEPIEVVVSKFCSKTIIVVEQKVNQRGAVSIEVNCVELAGNILKRVSVTSVPLQTQVNCCKLSNDEARLLFTCIDGSIAVLNRNRGSTITVKATFIPKCAAWHKSGAIAVVSNEKGQLQYYDSALNCIPAQLVAEDSTPITLIDLSGYFNNQVALDGLYWGQKDLLIAVEGGPLILKTHLESSLGFVSIAQSYLSSGKIEKTISILLSWDFNEQTFHILQKICVGLMKLPLTEENAKYLEDALGCYHNPAVPVSTEMRHKFGSQINSLTRRFFHQLVRASMFETAFLLAVDLGHHDLFMDLHFIAVKIGETEMAAAARAQASALLSRCSSEESLCSRSSCSQCGETDSCTSEDSITQEEGNIESDPIIPTSISDNYLTTNFNNATPKTYNPVPTVLPPISTVDLPKIAPKASYVKPPTAPLLSVKYGKNQSVANLVAPPLPFATSLSATNLNSVPNLGIPQANTSINSFNINPTRTFSVPSVLQNSNFNTGAFTPFKSSYERLPQNNSTYSNYSLTNPYSFTSQSSNANANRTPFMPVRNTIVPPLPVAPPCVSGPSVNASGASSTNFGANKKPQAKVKFSDTVTAFIVPEIKRPVRPPPPPHITNPQKELADSLPLCHPNEDYLKDFAPVRKSEPNETKAQPKIKVVHFGVV